MTAYLLAMASAAVYGAADFFGGLAARRASTLAVVVLSQLAGLVLLLVLLPALPASTPARADLTWGAVAGITGGAGVALLYRALAVGTMAVVAPITAVCAVAIPVMAAMALGERPGLQRGAGILLAIVSIVLISRQREVEDDPPFRGSGGVLPRGVGLALGAGVAIGLFFLALARTAAEAGLWPLVSARAVSIGLFAALGFAAGHSLRMGRRVVIVAAAAGSLDMAANALYLIATRSGPLSVVVTLASLYPASTVMLARIVLGERLSRSQWLGVGCTLIAVVLIVSSG